MTDLHELSMVPITPRPSARHAHAGEPNVSGRLERLIFLSDGVFAIAMTLLAVDLAISVIGSGPEPGDIGTRLLALWPKFLSFALSFVVIASYFVDGGWFSAAPYLTNERSNHMLSLLDKKEHLEEFLRRFR